MQKIVHIGAVSSGSIYTELNLAKVYVTVYPEKLNSSNFYTSITGPQGGGHVKVTYTPDGKAEVIFWGSESGTYNITLSSRSGASITKTITLTESEIVDKIVIGDVQDGIIKAGGKEKTVSVKFYHTYNSISNPGQTEDKQIDVEQGRVTKSIDTAGIDKNEFVTKTIDGIEGKQFVTGVSIKANADISITDGDYIAKELTINVNNDGLSESVTEDKKTVSQKQEINIYKPSEYTMLLEQANLDLYLTKDASNKMVVQDGSDLYTLFNARLGDQYPQDREYQKIKAENLSTSDNDLTGIENNQKIVFKHDSTKSYIKVAGFTTSAEGTYTKVTSGDIDLIGIAIDLSVDTDNLEDEKVAENPKVKVYHKNQTKEVGIITLNVVKNKLTKLNMETVKKSDYCYENSVVVTLESGEFERDLTGNELSLRVTGNGRTKVEIGEVSTVGGRIQVKLNAADPGTYTITAAIGNITATSDEIEVTDNPIVSRVEFVNKDGIVCQKTTESGTVYHSFGIARVGKPASRTLVYYHDYEAEKTRAFGESNVSRSVHAPETTNIHIDNKDNVNINVHEFSGDYEVGDGTEWHASDVNTITVSAAKEATIGEYKFDLKIDNKSRGGEELIEHVKVDIKEKAKIKDIILTDVNGSPLSSITLYKNQPEGISNVVQDDGKSYTVFGIKILDEDNDQDSVPTSYLSIIKR